MTHRTTTPDHPSHWRRWLRTTAFAFVLGGCGGGVETGGTGGTVNAVFSAGTITGFGSIIVGGVHFDDSRAAVTDADDSVRSRADLRLGMTAEVRGAAIGNDAAGTPVSVASSIVFGSDLLGPLTAIDRAANRLIVLGQTVDIGAVTVFDDVSLAAGPASLASGDVIEVFSRFDVATGRYGATRIERKSGITAFALRGPVSRLDTALKTFDIGTERISYAAFDGALPDGLANGVTVRVRLRTTQVGGAWLVTRIGDGVQRPVDGDAARLDGRVSAVVSATRFSVGGITVDASAVNTIGVALGVRVEVEGATSGGTVVATKLRVKSEGESQAQDFELRGSVASPNAAASSFVVRGVTVTYSGTGTEFRNGTAAGLVNGANVEARGKLSANGTQLAAARITLR